MNDTSRTYTLHIRKDGDNRTRGELIEIDGATHQHFSSVRELSQVLHADADHLRDVDTSQLTTLLTESARTGRLRIVQPLTEQRDARTEGIFGHEPLPRAAGMS